MIARTPGCLCLAGLLLSLGVMASGCATQKGPNDPERINTLAPPPPYAEVARNFNKRVERLDQFRGTAVVGIDYLNDKGEPEHTQGDGRIQIIRPDRLALDIGKVSTTLFWLGSDADRYWWLDLAAEPKTAFVGTHDRYDPELGRRLGIVVPPRDLLRLLAILPLPDAPDAGTTIRSVDGSMVGITTPISGGNTQRLWVDTKDYSPRQVELRDASGTPRLLAKLERPTFVTLTGAGGDLPSIAGRATVYHPESKSQFILDIGDVTDGKGRISPQAFDFDQIVKTFHPDRVVNLDERSRASVPAR